MWNLIWYLNFINKFIVIFRFLTKLAINFHTNPTYVLSLGTLWLLMFEVILK